MQDIALGVIGGTGLYRLAGLEASEALALETPYGSPSGPIRIGMLHGSKVAFLARHGESHALPPHRVNYRANVHALKQLGIQRVLALNTVGGIAADCGPRVLAVPDQIIDYTWGRISTFCEEVGTPVQHAEFAEPYSASLRAALLDAGRRAGVPLRATGCYGATQGPRLETCAEITRMRRDGCDLVGMTGMPEAALARELELDYACLAVVANWAAGCDPAGAAAVPITLSEVLHNVEAASAALPALLEALLHR